MLVIEINQIFTALQIKLRTKTLMIIKTLIATSDSLTASITTQSTDNGEDHIQLRYFSNSLANFVGINDLIPKLIFHIN